jgi:hypothetical protein
MPKFPPTRVVIKIIVISICSLVVGLACHHAWDSFQENLILNNVNAFSPPTLEFFTNLTRILFLILVLFSFGIKLTSGKSTSRRSGITRKGWWAFFSTLLVIASVVMLINPRSMYPFEIFPPLIDPARHRKVPIYQNLTSTPDLVIFGSSRTYRISAEYIQESLGYTSFHFGVNNAGTRDMLVQARFMANIPSRAMPKVLLIEILPELPPNDNKAAQNSPFALLQYMELKTIWLFFQYRFIELTNINQFIESVYVLQQKLLPPTIAILSSTPPEIPIPVESPETPIPIPSLKDEFEQKLARHLKSDVVWCDEINLTGAQDIRQLVQFAIDHNTAVIIFNSPWHPEFYDQKMKSDQNYLSCQQSFENFISDLQQEYENLYFLNFTLLESIQGVADETGFLDSYHLAEINSELLIDASADTIDDAYQWALEERSGP